MRFHITPGRIGQGIGAVRATLHSVDRAATTAGKIFKATKHLMPDSALKKQMEKGVSSYEELRRKIKDGAD